MHGVNYYDLLREGVQAIRTPDWEEVVKSVVFYRKDLEDFDGAFDALYAVCLECSQEWIAQRSKIIREASQKHANPSRRSDYCLKALREIAEKGSREAALSDAAPDAVIVQRQISDHLRNLNHSGLLVSEMVRSRTGKDLYKLWGLKDWGDDWRTRSPLKPLEEMREDLPIIESSGGGRGVFDYSGILPTYIQRLLATYGAALGTAQIKSLICSRVSPPLFGEPLDTDVPCKDPSPENVAILRQRLKEIRDNLKDSEKTIFDKSLEGNSSRNIAELLNVPVQTVQNFHRNILRRLGSGFAAAVALFQALRIP